MNIKLHVTILHVILVIAYLDTIDDKSIFGITQQMSSLNGSADKHVTCDGLPT